MIKDHEPRSRDVAPKSNGSHLEPRAKDVTPRQKTAGRTVGSDGKFSSNLEGVPSGIEEPKRNLTPRKGGTKDSPPPKWVAPKVPRPPKPPKNTPRHEAKRVI